MLTGGPCSGKTTTIDELAKRGYPVLAEPARLVIDQQLATGKTIGEIVGDDDFLASIVRYGAAQERALSKEEVWFLDRATPDSIAYHRKFGKELAPVLVEALEEIKYRKVFLLSMIDAYENDAARYESPEEAQELHEGIRRAYQELGYEVIDVPVIPVSERVDYILARL